MPAEEVYDEAMKTVEEELEELFGGPKAEAGPSRNYGADMLRAVQQVADDLAASVSAVLPPDVGQVVHENALVVLLVLAVACLALIYGASPALHLMPVWAQLPDPSGPCWAVRVHRCYRCMLCVVIFELRVQEQGLFYLRDRSMVAAEMKPKAPHSRQTQWAALVCVAIVCATAGMLRAALLVWLVAPLPVFYNRKHSANPQISCQALES